jgi:hypothetical protein
MNASQPQRWAIFIKTGYDVRGCELTTEQAKQVLDATDEIAIQLVSTIPNSIKKADRKPKQDWERIYNEAHTAGMAAGQACQPVGMVVQQHANPLNDNSPVVKSWDVPDGVCGFAWVVVSPGTHSFARWAAKNLNAKKDYYGGVTVKWVGEFGQSMQRKIAYAQAFAGVLHKYNVPVGVRDRMD